MKRFVKVIVVVKARGMAIRSSVFLQLQDKLSNWMVEMAGFNQPPEFSAKDFSKRQGTLKHVKQILPIYAYHCRRPKPLMRSNPIWREATSGYENTSANLGMT